MIRPVPPNIDDALLPVISAWYDAVAIDCRLHDLEQLVESLRCDDDSPDYWRRYERWKAELAKLVGWHAERAELRTSEWYTVCHSYLLHAWEWRPAA